MHHSLNIFPVKLKTSLPKIPCFSDSGNPGNETCKIVKHETMNIVFKK